MATLYRRHPVSRRLTAAGFVFALLCLPVLPLSVSTAAAETAADTDHLAEGNAAFRAADYGRALEHYSAARDAIPPSQTEAQSQSLIDFNTGLAYARLGNPGLAQDWLIAAASDPRLAPRAYYSLGILRQAQDDPADARVWLLQAMAHPQASPRLRQLTRQALEPAGGPAGGSADGRVPRDTQVRRIRQRSPSVGRAEARLDDPFFISLSTQLAYDSNIYRAPSSDYIDIAAATAPLVTPDQQSGWFAPVALASRLRWGQRDDSEFALDYSLNGRFYTDSEFSNANELAQRLALSGTLDARSDPRFRRGTFLHSALAVERRDAQAYDRTDGDDQLLNGEDVSDRLTYTRYGPEFDLHQDLGPIRVGLDGYGVMTRYDDDSIPELDYSHEQYNLGAFVLYRPWRRTQIELGVDATQRNYDYRPARDLNGDRFSNAPTQEFFYQEAALVLRQRLNSAFWFSVGYAYTDREDQHLGYDDYQRHTGRAALYLGQRRFKASAAVVWRDYEFPNGFAFDTPLGGEKTLTTTAASLRAEFEVAFNLTVHAMARYDVSDTTDLRADYDRSQASLGVRWDW